MRISGERIYELHDSTTGACCLEILPDVYFEGTPK